MVRPKDYRTASWSWASIIGKVSFRDILEAEHRDKVEILDVAVTTSPGKEGQVTGGHLTMRAPVLKGGWVLNIRSMKAGTRRASYSESARRAAEGSADIWNSDWADGQESDSFAFQHLLLKVPEISGYPDVEPDGFEKGMTTLVAIRQMVPTDLSSRSSFCFLIECLVLVEEGSGTFRRSGMFLAKGKKIRVLLSRVEGRCG